MRRLLATLFALSTLVAPATALALPKVLICYADPSPQVAQQIASGINPGGQVFAAVDIMDCSKMTPTVQQLKMYEAVFAWDDLQFADKTGLGNNFADYVDAGGGVVLGMFTFYNQGGQGWDLQGRWSTGNGGTGYNCVKPGNQQQANGLANMPNDPNSPLVKGVMQFTPLNTGSGGLNAGAKSAWDYSNGQPAIAQCMPAGHLRVDTNFYPNPNNWKGDGYQIIQNALVAVAGGLSPLRGTPSPVAFPDTGTGGVSSPLTVTFTNTSMAAQTATDLAITGANAAEFGVVKKPNFPVTLQPMQTLTVDVNFAPATMGARTAKLSISLMQQMGMMMPPPPAEVTLQGNGIGAKLVITPNPINVGGTQIGQTITANVTVANNGGGKITISTITLADPAYAITAAPDLPLIVGNGGSFMVTISFTPTQNGITKDNLVFTTSDANSPTLKVPVSGYAGPPAIGVDAVTVAFGNINLMAKSVPTIVTVSNVGFSDLTVSSVVLQGANQGDFMLDKKALPGVIGAQQSSPIAIVFAPTAQGNRLAQIVISSDDQNAPTKTINLIGTGTSATLGVTWTGSPAALDFGTSRVGVASKGQDVTVSSMGNGQLKVQSITFSGPNAADFSQSGGMAPPFNVMANGMAVMTLSCKPDAIGMLAATATIATDVGSSMVDLKCAGTSPRISVMPNQIDFGPVPLMMKSPKIPVTITNTGTDTLNFMSLSIGGASSNDFDSQDMPMAPSIVPMSSVTFHVDCTPSMQGPEMGEIDFTTDDPLLPTGHINMLCTGAVEGLSITPQPLDFGVVSLGASSTPMPVTIKNTGDLPLLLTSLAVGGNGATSFRLDRTIDMMNTVNLVAQQAIVVNVTFAPNTAGAISVPLVVTATGIAPVSITLKGNGCGPRVVFGVPGGGSSYDFMSVDVGKSGGPQEIVIQNKSDCALTIDKVNSPNAAFTVDTSKSTLALAKGMMTSVYVSFTPAKAGAIESKMDVYLPGASMPVASLKLAGTGTTPPSMMVMPGTSGCAVSGTNTGLPGAPALAVLILLAALAIRRRFKEVR